MSGACFVEKVECGNQVLATWMRNSMGKFYSLTNWAETVTHIFYSIAFDIALEQAPTKLQGL